MKKAKPPHVGIRVRLLRKVEREAPLNLAWAVEEGLVSYNGDVWTEKRIISRHENQMAASKALCMLLKTKEGA
jgi:hypothetical protein